MVHYPDAKLLHFLYNTTYDANVPNKFSSPPVGPADGRKSSTRQGCVEELGL